MRRFFCPETDFSSTEIILNNSDELHHLKNVLRLKEGQELLVFNGKGKEAHGLITKLSANEATIKILDIKSSEERGGPRLILACAIPKRGKFETIIEKCTELGVDEIVPVITSRTEVELKGERLDKKLARYQAVAVSAAKQSHRLTVPQIHLPTKFRDALDRLSQTSTVL
ncbi:MAG: 16S rRNA (uracil(1498)-N(3))-methyltransferase, partial [Candidatus Omnitrophica bacterium]|nr:16S rRNA (uracil(1498)-N(3))-methyltransferase [Candidatus Omnitrophota bacterium]